MNQQKITQKELQKRKDLRPTKSATYI